MTRTSGIANGWTGGQYSVYRVVFGLVLMVHFFGLLPWAVELASRGGTLPEVSASPLVALFPNVLRLIELPALVVVMVAMGALLSVAFAAGYRDRMVAVALWYVWACLVSPNAGPESPFVGWLLLFHAFLPAAPFGSLSARGRPDPGGGWRMPRAIFTAAWTLLAFGYAYGGASQLISSSSGGGNALQRLFHHSLASPGALQGLMHVLPAGPLQVVTWVAVGLELAFVPLALFRRVRPWIWTTMLILQLAVMLLVDLAGVNAGMVLLHFFTFDPAWIRPARSEDEEVLFYDGNCGLCHAAFRAVLAEDRSGRAFRFAPLGGTRFLETVPEDKRRNLPDSLVVSRANGDMLTRSRAVIHVGRRLGGIWRAGSAAGALVPASIADRIYDLVAAVRHRLFRRPAEVCPSLPAKLRSRFDD